MPMLEIRGVHKAYGSNAPPEAPAQLAEINALIEHFTKEKASLESQLAALGVCATTRATASASRGMRAMMECAAKAARNAFAPNRNLAKNHIAQID